MDSDKQQKPWDAEWNCTLCAKCCYLRVEIMLLDIERIAQLLDRPSKEMFELLANYEDDSDTMLLAKDESGRCHFLGEGNLCGVHQDKPWTCRVYLCAKDGRETASYLDYFDNVMGRDTFWEMVVAQAETARYVHAHGGKWHEAGYRAGVEATIRQLEVPDTRRIRVAKGLDGTPNVMHFDCSTCDKRANCCTEAPVSLDDIVQLAGHLDMPLDAFFERYVAHHPSTRSEGLLALKDPALPRCPFLAADDLTCNARDALPAQCRFIPCPLLMTGELAERLLLSAGSVEEQYRHQVAASITRRYIEQCGVGYQARAFDQCMSMIEQLAADQASFEDFRQQLVQFRHIPEA
ncbi:MAG: YkgJ family cysteine cluster protein [bacterium]|nr:YkgJ family cysteine cluster protein [bacterium]